LRADTSVVSAQAGLSDAQKHLNYFLSGQCMPSEAMDIQRVDVASSRSEGTVLAKEVLSENVILLRLQADINYQAGQYVTLWKDQSLARSYSLASLPNDDQSFDLHSPPTLTLKPGYDL
jgi:hypothetical protein